ncbi:hypothetical protein BY996DRAFT_6409584 [Phakopsora pachyrhizi]|nr:hypothetical protein BY996DRAFT_6409584 [Phakopsora pachyrhizi]
MDHNVSAILSADSGGSDSEPQTEIRTRGIQSSLRTHFTWTCPSLYQVNPRDANKGTSLGILREFMSRPDGAPKTLSEAPNHDTLKNGTKIALKKALLLYHDSNSTLETIQSSPGVLNVGQGEGSSKSNNDIHPALMCRSIASGSTHKVSEVAENSLEEKIITDNSSDKGNYRCPSCNRLCKSKASFEKHRSACTHRNGELNYL